MRGFTQIVEFALVQPHRSVANGARDGSETFFHVARRTESWRPETISAFGARCKRCLAKAKANNKAGCWFTAGLGPKDVFKLPPPEFTTAHALSEHN